MARNTVDACMFCGFNPCQCGKPAKKAAPKVVRVPKTSLSPAAEERSHPQSSGEQVGSSSSTQGRSNLGNVTRVRNPETEALAAAITLFAEREMLHPDTIREHRDLIRLDDHTIRGLIWKQENADIVRQST